MALALAAEANERAVDADRRGELLDRDAHDGVDVELGSHALADARDQALALQRVGERPPRGDPLEGQRCLGGKRAQERDLLLRERPALREGDHEHRVHMAVGDDRDEGGTVGADALGQAPVDELRRGRRRRSG